MQDWNTYDITDYHRLEYLGKDTQEILIILLDNIKAGVGLFEVGEHIRALYLNKEYFECIGYSREEYEPNQNDIFATLLPEDAAGFSTYIKEQSARNEGIEYSVRGYRQDGSVGWFTVKGAPIENKITDKPIYLTSVTDISDTKEKERQLQELQRANSELEVQQERYRVLEATAQGLLFEYYPDKDKMVFSYNFPNNKKRKEIEHYQKYLEEFPMVHSDHIAKFKEALRTCCMQETEGDLEYLSTVSGGGYRWHTTHYKSVVGNNKKIISVVGRICDIHDAKLEKERIHHQAERDGLTDVYHKDVAFEKMAEYVKEAPHSKFYFVILDMDNFKAINDQFGHQYGDIVIKNIADLLQEAFGEESIIGRFGGDEFMLLTKNVALSEVRRRLEQIQTKIKFCAGIVEWKSGDRLEEVFERADKTMYKVKTGDKNKIQFD
ncbi:MAG: diguanylate cyclase [Bacteroidales bacterium]|nr:diguanylate cyclase [Clostridium sp.]MCM1205013.1 diguanylate cyclase [Bacteroidales bacterium]